MIILGVDPGSRFTGFGFVEIQGKYPKYLASGTIKTSNEKYLIDRIRTLHGAFSSLITQYHPDQIAIEEVFINLNPKSSLILGQARGAILAFLVQANCPISQYTALQIKKSIIGHGRAKKFQLKEQAKNLLNIKNLDLRDDSSDALCVALCHYFHCTWPSGQRK